LKGRVINCENLEEELEIQKHEIFFLQSHYIFHFQDIFEEEGLFSKFYISLIRKVSLLLNYSMNGKKKKEKKENTSSGC